MNKNELRKDYFQNRWIVIAAEREKRPRDFKKPAPMKSELKEKNPKCPFCPGNEQMTPPEVMRVEKKGKWVIRVFPNKFPALKEMGGFELKEKKFEIGGNGQGKHEVVVETPLHNLQMGDLSVKRIAKVFEVCAERQRELQGGGLRHVSVFKNKGVSAGTSLVHSHMQIIAMPEDGKEVLDEANAERKWRRGEGRSEINEGVKCGYCAVRKKEMKGKRNIAENGTFSCFVPWAARFGYEVWFVPKRHVNSLVDLSEGELKGLAELVKKCLVKLGRLNVDYNLLFHSSPKGKDLHFHVHLAPRLSKWAGFEHESGTIINAFPPESAANFYRSGK